MHRTQQPLCAVGCGRPGTTQISVAWDAREGVRGPWYEGTETQKAYQARPRNNAAGPFFASKLLRQATVVDW